VCSARLLGGRKKKKQKQIPKSRLAGCDGYGVTPTRSPASVSFLQYMCVCVCMCARARVRACDRESERARERAREGAGARGREGKTVDRQIIKILALHRDRVDDIHKDTCPKLSYTRTVLAIDSAADASVYSYIFFLVSSLFSFSFDDIHKGSLGFRV